MWKTLRSSLILASAWEVAILLLATLICWQRGTLTLQNFTGTLVLTSVVGAMIGSFIGGGYQPEIKCIGVHLSEKVPGTESGLQARLFHSAHQVGMSANILLASAFVVVFSFGLGGFLETVAG